VPDDRRHAVGHYPRSVTPGIETQSSLGLVEWLTHVGCFVRPDWLRLTGREELAAGLITWACERHGVEVPEPCTPPKLFRRAVGCGPGVVIASGHANGLCMLDLRGERLQSIGGEAAMLLLRDLRRDFPTLTPTRVDICIDWVGCGIDLVGSILASCHAGELCGLRTWKDGTEHVIGGLDRGRAVRLGSRESEVFARAYDKGVQTRSAPAGHWERLEAEFKGARASAAADLLLSDEDWPTSDDQVPSRTCGNGTAPDRSHRRPSWCWNGRSTGPGSAEPASARSALQRRS
jgi:hypothetical protein